MNRRDELDRARRRLSYFLWDVVLFALVFILLVGLAGVHTAQGGWSTAIGSALGVLWLVLLFSPVITKSLGLLSSVRRHPWFETISGWVRLGRATTFVAALMAAVYVWLFGGRPADLSGVLERLLRFLGVA